MANPRIVNKVYDWLMWGYGVYVNGSLSSKIALSPDGDYFAYQHFGSSATEATKDGLEWLMDVIFETEDFVAIDSNGFLHALTPEATFYLNNVVCDFTLIDRNGLDECVEHPFMKWADTIANFIAHKEDIVCDFNKAHGTNIVRVFATREQIEGSKFNRFWFAC